MLQWDAQAALAHYRELLAEAEAERRARHIAGHGRSLFQILRLNLGRELIALGRRLAPEVPLAASPLGLPVDLERYSHNSVSYNGSRKPT